MMIGGQKRKSRLVHSCKRQ